MLEVQVTLFAWDYAEICIIYMHSKLLSIVTIKWVDDSKASLRSSQHGEASASPKRTITKLVALCAHGGYKASFEACLMDLGGLEKQQKASWHGVVLRQFSQGFSTRACFWTGCRRPTAVLKGFKLVIVAYRILLDIQATPPLDTESTKALVSG